MKKRNKKQETRNKMALSAVTTNTLTKFNELFESNEYQQAQPFPHVVIDDFLAEEEADRLSTYAKSLDPKKAPESRNFKHCREKFAYPNINSFPIEIQYIFEELTSRRFIHYLEQLTGIQGLIPNEHSLFGGGFHKIAHNGYLDMHTDFNQYKNSRYGLLDRRINLLLYLNKDWTPTKGGHLYLADSKTKDITHKILPIFNRAVIFNTTKHSIHGHPRKLNAPGETRDSIALYYYTRAKGHKCFEGDNMHSTIYYESSDFI
jgi:Rps23 Pro-64 3,4-dihydroxylase Tpa1-like proline 4-hydroxylase